MSAAVPLALLNDAQIQPAAEIVPIATPTLDDSLMASALATSERTGRAPL
jgi:hypothetical protein